MIKKIEFFKKRTGLHIARVKKYAGLIVKEFPELKGLERIASKHDSSKYSSPEFDYYVEMTWYHKMKDEKRNPIFNKEWLKGSAHHVKTNRHHPEFHDPAATSKSVDGSYIVDASRMPKMDMAEMCADLMSMSKELGGRPQDFYTNNINKRWKFTKEQQDFMMNIFNNVWK